VAEPERRQRLLAFLGPRLPELPVLALAAARKGERPVRLFAATASDPAGRPLWPAPLSPCAYAMLVAARFRAHADEAFCSACHAATGGNPPTAQERGALLVELGSAELLTDGSASIAHLGEALPFPAQPKARAEVSIKLARS
jgi:hypothetical protein